MIVIITQRIKINLLMPFGKPHMAPMRQGWPGLIQMAQKGSNPGQFFNIVSS